MACFGLFRLVLGLLVGGVGSFCGSLGLLLGRLTCLGRFGLFWFVLGYFRSGFMSFWLVLGGFGSGYVSIFLVKAYFELFLLILCQCRSHCWSFWLI